MQLKLLASPMLCTHNGACFKLILDWIGEPNHRQSQVIIFM